MSLKEYLDYDTKTSMSDYWIQKARESTERQDFVLARKFSAGRNL